MDRAAAAALAHDRAPDSAVRPQADADAFIHWLLASVEVETSVFHVGQYCGTWHASTAGRALASYHLVLRGECFVHLEGRAPIALGPRDAVFFLRDVPHFLSADASGAPPLVGAAMEPLSQEVLGSVGLACGFFHFRGALSRLLADGLPDHVILRAGTEELASTRALFELILAEGGRDPSAPSPLVARLADLLFFYVLRHVVKTDASASGLWSLVRNPQLASLVEAVLKDPAKSWTVESMAKSCGMSRASFFKHFEQASGTSPGQFLLLVRMRVAARRLAAGDSAIEAAEQVGYQSLAAFSRAFKKVIGQQPSAYRRALSCPAAATESITDF
ncbi:MAG TPA: AraC family transcriptional regulator [Polyangiaceae bacterium]|nr:AraC family transcriptional regulator [Polyangiaceae bacterium]